MTDRELFLSVFEGILRCGVYNDFLDGYHFSCVDTDNLYILRALTNARGDDIKIHIIYFNGLDYRGHPKYEDVFVCDEHDVFKAREILHKLKSQMPGDFATEWNDTRLVNLAYSIGTLALLHEGTLSSYSVITGDIVTDVRVCVTYDEADTYTVSAFRKDGVKYLSYTCNQYVLNIQIGNYALIYSLWSCCVEQVLSTMYTKLYKHYYFNKTNNASTTLHGTLVLDDVELNLSEGKFIPKDASHLAYFLGFYRGVFHDVEVK